MSQNKCWKEMVKSSEDSIWSFNCFKEDRAIVWANNEIKDFRRAFMMLVMSNTNHSVNLGEEDSKFIEEMIERAVNN